MEKARLIVLTDIGPWTGEPDDAQSLVRLLLYANEYDIEGIIPKNECLYTQEGLPEKDIAIISRVGKPICLKIIGKKLVFPAGAIMC